MFTQTDSASQLIYVTNLTGNLLIRFDRLTALASYSLPAN
jgi:hypothetical protein